MRSYGGGEEIEVELEVELEGGGVRSGCAWVEALISGESNFFAPCGLHQSFRKNDMNVFCLHCCLTICPHCLPSHPSHPLLQIRRYVYHHVVRLGDLHNLIDCSYIQPYTINGAKVIFLNHRPHSSNSASSSSSSSSKPHSNFCLTCHRILQHPFHFCSLSCKVVEGAAHDVSSTIIQFHPQITPNSSIGLNNSSSNNTNANFHRLPPGGIVLSLGSRRKGAPQRAPLS